MISKINTCSIVGNEAHLVMVETDVHNGLPDFKIVGATSTDVKDARDRVRVGIENAGFILPPKRITVSLVPAPLKKNGTSLDVAIAVSVLSSFGFIHNDNLAEYMILGEVGLDGALREVKGVTFAVLYGLGIGIKRFIVPVGNLPECSLFKDLDIIGFHNLFDLAVYFNGDIGTAIRPAAKTLQKPVYPDFSDISGEKECKVAIVAAMAGRHTCLVTGGGQEIRRELIRPASGMYNLNSSDILMKTGFHSINDVPDLDDPEIIGVPVYFFKDSKAYKEQKRRVLFFTGCINVYEYDETEPDDNMHFYSLYSCKCKAENADSCICTPRQIKEIQLLFQKIMAEQADIEAKVGDGESISSECLERMYENACRLQEERYKDSFIKYNAEIPDKDIGTYCILTEEAKVYLNHIIIGSGIGNQGKNRILRVSRTIADMDGQTLISLKHIKYAMKLRGINE